MREGPKRSFTANVLRSSLRDHNHSASPSRSVPEKYQRSAHGYRSVSFTGVEESHQPRGSTGDDDLPGLALPAPGMKRSHKRFTKRFKTFSSAIGSLGIAKLKATFADVNSKSERGTRGGRLSASVERLSSRVGKLAGRKEAANSLPQAQVRVLQPPKTRPQPKSVHPVELPPPRSLEEIIVQRSEHSATSVCSLPVLDENEKMIFSDDETARFGPIPGQAAEERCSPAKAVDPPAPVTVTAATLSLAEQENIRAKDGLLELLCSSSTALPSTAETEAMNRRRFRMACSSEQSLRTSERMLRRSGSSMGDSFSCASPAVSFSSQQTIASTNHRSVVGGEFGTHLSSSFTERKAQQHPAAMALSPAPEDHSNSMYAGLVTWAYSKVSECTSPRASMDSCGGSTFGCKAASSTIAETAQGSDAPDVEIKPGLTHSCDRTSSEPAPEGPSCQLLHQQSTVQPSIPTFLARQAEAG